MSATNYTQTGPIPPVFESPNSNNQVSWQSAFWGVFSLALNTFIQNPGNFALGSNGPARLVRTSPFVCGLEALDITITFCWKRFVRHVPWSKTASSILLQRGLERGQQDAEANLITRFVTVFLAISQLIKLTGMSGIPFTTFCAWAYFASFLALECSKVIATQALNSDQFTDHEASEQSESPTLLHDLRFGRTRDESVKHFLVSQIKPYGYLAALLLQLGMILHLSSSLAPDQLWSEKAPETCAKRLDWYFADGTPLVLKLLGGPWLGIMMFPGVQLTMIVGMVLYLVVYVISAVCLFVLFAIIAPFTKSIRRRLADWWGEGTPQLRTSNDWIEFLFGLTSMAAMGWIFYNLPCLEFLLNVLVWYVNNVICYFPPNTFYAAAVGIPSLKYLLRSASKLTILENVKALKSNHMEIIFSVWFFAVALCYYSEAYDPSSTFKPTWTEALG